MPAASGIRVDWERDGRLDLPEPLVKAVRDRKCMLFVGSGLSSMAGYPSWGELVDSLLQASKKIPYARTGGLEEYERQKDYFTLAEFARSSLGASQYTALLRDQLSRPVRPTAAHELIASTDYRGLITTITIACSRPRSRNHATGLRIHLLRNRYRLWLQPCITRISSSSSSTGTSGRPRASC